MLKEDGTKMKLIKLPKPIKYFADLGLVSYTIEYDSRHDLSFDKVQTEADQVFLGLRGFKGQPLRRIIIPGKTETFNNYYSLDDYLEFGFSYKNTILRQLKKLRKWS